MVSRSRHPIVLFCLTLIVACQGQNASVPPTAAPVAETLAAPSPPAVQPSASGQSSAVPAGLWVVPPTSATSSDFVARALTLIPGDSPRFTYTDWDGLKAYHGVAAMTSLTPRSERVDFMIDVLNRHQASARMDSAFFYGQAELWGWDSTDLLWEASGQAEDLLETAHVLRFRPGYDFEPLVNQLIQMEFERLSHQGLTIFSFPLAKTPDWHFRSNLAQHNVALIPEEGLAIFAPVPGGVEQILNVYRGLSTSLADEQLVQLVAGDLASLAAVDMRIGERVCFQFGPHSRWRGSPAALDPFDGLAVQPYSLLAVGHHFDQGSDTNLVLMLYQDQSIARADLDRRQALWTAGQSPRYFVPYRQNFDLRRASVNETGLLRFELAPRQFLQARTGWPQTVLGWMQDQDILFAGCA